MNRWKWAAIAAAGAALLLLCLLVAAHFQLSSYEKTIEQYASQDLVKKGYSRGTWEKPVVKDAPAGTKPLAHIEGVAVYSPHRGAAATVSPTKSQDSNLSPFTVQSSPPTCNLDDLEISIKCAADVLALPSQPWAKLVVSGTVTGYGQTRQLPESVAGRISLQVDPAAKPSRLPREVRLGVGLPGPTVRAGFTYMFNRRLGVYGDLAAPYSSGNDFAVGGGIAFRF